MYKLYGEIAGWKMLDISSNEGDILQTIGEYLSDSENMHFLIVKNENDTDEPYKAIRSIDDYVHYLGEYNRRLKEMSCIELREEMMDIVYDKPKVKTNRR